MKVYITESQYKLLVEGLESKRYASAGAYVYAMDEQNLWYILVVQRYNNLWSIPMGMSERFDKTPLETSIRETAEETGVDIRTASFFEGGEIQWAPSKWGKDYIAVLKDRIDPNVKLCGDGENLNVIWYPVESMDDLNMRWGQDANAVNYFRNFIKE